jgi:FixJ family two-component response regulator
VDEFIKTLERIVRGASVVDPALVSELVAAQRREDPLDVLSPRELEVLALMAEGRSNAGIAHELSGSPRARSRSTFAASSRSCGCLPPRTTSVASLPSSPFWTRANTLESSATG